MSFPEENLGQNLVIGSYTFTAEEIIDFARKYDPQPFHLDSEAAKRASSADFVLPAGTPLQCS